MKQPSRPVRLGIGGLPTELRNLRLGHAYGVASREARASVQLIAATVAEALSARQPAVVIGNLPFASLFEQLAKRDIDGHQALRNQRLRLYRTDPDSASRLLRAGTVQLLDELDHFDLPAGGIILLAPAESLLPNATAAESQRHLQLLRNWLRHRALTLLTLFESGSSPVLSDAGFDGVAELASEGEALRWTTQYWRLAEGHVISPEYSLRTLPDGSLGVDTRVTTGDQQLDARLAQAADEERVVVTASVVRGEQRIPTLWEIADDLEALVLRAGDAVAATCVLETDGPNRFRDLARTIHGLRLRRGPALKIVVYEVGSALRHSQEQLLLALGANVVVLGRGVGRLRTIVAGLRGQRYQREVNPDFGEAFMAGLPEAHAGYLPADQFCTVMTEGARRAAALSLESVLVRMTLRPGLDPLTALRALNIRRPGDLFTHGDGSVYLFLFGCWDRDVDQILERLFTLPVGELFESQLRFPTNSAATTEAGVLYRRLQLAPATDYSPLLESRQLVAASYAAPQEPVDSPQPSPAVATPELPPPRRTLSPITLPLRRMA